MSPDQKPKGTLFEWMRYANIGIEMLVSVFIGRIRFGLFISYQTLADDRRFYFGFGCRVSESFSAPRARK
jgi:hypothetical protein